MFKTAPLFFAAITLTLVGKATTNAGENAPMDVNCPFNLEASYIGDFYRKFAGSKKQALVIWEWQTLGWASILKKQIS